MKHPSHKAQTTSLKRIEGQIRGIQKMIDEGKYCVDILNQVKAVRKAITTVEGRILEKHLQSCVKQSLKDSSNFDEKVQEIMSVLKRQ